MKPSRSVLVVALVLTALLISGARSSAFALDPGYVALGDSIEAGFGASSPDKRWVSLFRSYLIGKLGPATELVNLGIPGATVRDIQQEQLVPALVAIATHSPVVVSWGGGGNDLLDFIASPQAATCLHGNVSCLTRLNALLNNIQQTIDVTVKALREAAGPDTKILLRTQYNPFLPARCDPSGTQAALAAVVLEGEAPPFLTSGLNDRIRDVAVKYSARVIDVYQVFALKANDPSDDYIAADCIHPDDLGHKAISDAAQFAF